MEVMQHGPGRYEGQEGPVLIKRDRTDLWRSHRRQCGGSAPLRPSPSMQMSLISMDGDDLRSSDGLCGRQMVFISALGTGGVGGRRHLITFFLKGCIY